MLHHIFGSQSKSFAAHWPPPTAWSQQAESLDGALCVPDIKLHSNPSAFNVYCNVRHCVLDWQQREASLALASRSSVQSGDSDSEEEEEYREPAVKLPKVGARRSRRRKQRVLAYFTHQASSGISWTSQFFVKVTRATRFLQLPAFVYPLRSTVRQHRKMRLEWQFLPNFRWL